jgi:hypothetical protein
MKYFVKRFVFYIRERWKGEGIVEDEGKEGN